MSYSLDTPSIQTLKTEAKALRETRALTPTPLGHGAALEEVARRHGYRDWNTASAALPERVAVPVQVGQRVKGTYLSRPFTGMVIAMKLLPDMAHFEVTVKFDKPVNVSKFASMVHERQRVTATIDVHGVTAARTSDGEPHMRVSRQ
jgi:Glyoxalase superfamily protein